MKDESWYKGRIAELEELNSYFINLKHTFEICPDIETGLWAILFPDLPGCVAQGETLIEVLRAAKHVVELWIKTCRQQSMDIPKQHEHSITHRHWILNKQFTVSQSKLKHYKEEWDACTERGIRDKEDMQAVLAELKKGQDRIRELESKLESAYRDRDEHET